MALNKGHCRIDKDILADTILKKYYIRDAARTGGVTAYKLTDAICAADIVYADHNDRPLSHLVVVRVVHKRVSRA